MQGVIIGLLWLFVPLVGNTQSFEGRIDFVQKSLSDTTYITYFVKGNKVRIEERDASQYAFNHLLVDLQEETIMALNPDSKLYVNLPLLPYSESVMGEFSIRKTENTKLINGYECYQWRVKNEIMDTEVAYWVAKEQLFFYEGLLRLLNRTEKTAQYYLQIPSSEGYFPMSAVERSLLRITRVELEVVGINQEQLKEQLFFVPSDYVLFEGR